MVGLGLVMHKAPTSSVLVADTVALAVMVMIGRSPHQEWLGGRSKEILADVDIGWCSPRDRPGLAAAIFSTPRGEVRI